MKDIFEHALSTWVKYSEYELKKDKQGTLYIKPTDNSKPQLYSVTKSAEEIVLAALTVGMMCVNKEPEDKIQTAIMDLISNYGLLGLMTSITTTPRFMDYEAVYLMKNRFIKSEVMNTMEYLSIFFPFDKPQIIKSGIKYKWDIEGDNLMMALAMTFGNYPTAVNIGFQRMYAEPYEWVKKQLMDWAVTFSTTLMYYEDKNMEDDLKELYQLSMSAFDGISPTYHIALIEDAPKLVWDFHSLSLAIQMMFSLMLTDEQNPIRICKHCAKIFKASRPSAVFCSPQCKNRYNVYKSRKKDKKQDI